MALVPDFQSEVTNNNNPTVNASAQVGDLAIVVYGLDGNQSGSLTPSNNWQFLASATGDAGRPTGCYVMWKLLESGDIGNAVPLPSGFTVSRVGNACYIWDQDRVNTGDPFGDIATANAVDSNGTNGVNVDRLVGQHLLIFICGNNDGTTHSFVPTPSISMTTLFTYDTSFANDGSGIFGISADPSNANDTLFMDYSVSPGSVDSAMVAIMLKSASSAPIVKVVSEALDLTDEDLTVAALLRQVVESIELSEADLTSLGAALVKIVSESSEISESDLSLVEAAPTGFTGWGLPIGIP